MSSPSMYSLCAAKSYWETHNYCHSARKMCLPLQHQSVQSTQFVHWKDTNYQHVIQPKGHSCREMLPLKVCLLCYTRNIFEFFVHVALCCHKMWHQCSCEEWTSAKVSLCEQKPGMLDVRAGKNIMSVCILPELGFDESIFVSIIDCHKSWTFSITSRLGCICCCCFCHQFVTTSFILVKSNWTFWGENTWFCIFCSQKEWTPRVESHSTKTMTKTSFLPVVATKGCGKLEGKKSYVFPKWTKETIISNQSPLTFFLTHILPHLVSLITALITPGSSSPHGDTILTRFTIRLTLFEI